MKGESFFFLVHIYPFFLDLYQFQEKCLPTLHLINLVVVIVPAILVAVVEAIVITEKLLLEDLADRKLFVCDLHTYNQY